MNIKITNDNENVLIERRELNFETTFEGATPNRNEIKNKLSAMIDASTNLIIIDNMKTEFGNQKLIGYAKVYKNEERLKEIESNHQLNRNSLTQRVKDISNSSELESKKEEKKQSE